MDTVLSMIKNDARNEHTEEKKADKVEKMIYFSVLNSKRSKVNSVYFAFNTRK